MHLIVNRRFFQKAALASFGIILALLILEGGLWITGFGGADDPFNQMQFDPELGWTTQKSSRFFYSARHSAHFNYYGPEGFPATTETWKDAMDSQTQSIVFIGDSFTEGFYLPYKETFVHKINLQFPDKQVVNLGVTGYAPDQYLLQSRRHLPRYNATDIIVMFFPANDVPEARLATSNGFSKPLLNDTMVSPTNLPLTKKERPSTPTNPIRKIQTKSAVFQVVRPVLNRFVLSPLGLGEKSLFSGNVLVAEEYTKTDMMWSIQLINQIKVENPNSNFLAYYIPRLEELQARDIYNSNEKLFLSSCDEFGIRCFTATKIFGFVDDAAKVYLPFDGHFSEVGSALVADHLTEILETR